MDKLIITNAKFEYEYGLNIGHIQPKMQRLPFVRTKYRIQQIRHDNKKIDYMYHCLN